MTDVEKKTATIIRGLIDQKSGNRDSPTDDTMKLHLSDLGLDSLEKMDLAMQLEDAFGTSLDEEDFLACDTVSDLVRLIEGTTAPR